MENKSELKRTIITGLISMIIGGIITYTVWIIQYNREQKDVIFEKKVSLMHDLIESFTDFQEFRQVDCEYNILRIQLLREWSLEPNKIFSEVGEYSKFEAQFQKLFPQIKIDRDRLQQKYLSSQGNFIETSLYFNEDVRMLINEFSVKIVNKKPNDYFQEIKDTLISDAELEVDKKALSAKDYFDLIDEDLINFPLMQTIVFYETQYYSQLILNAMAEEILRKK